MAKNRFLLYITLLISASLACGVSTSLPVADVIPTSHEVYLPPTSEPVNQYIVTAETLQIRTGAGETFPALKVYLSQNEIVTCSETKTAKDGGLWCKHEKGWSNIRYMKGLK